MAFTRYALALALIVIEALTVPVVERLDLYQPERRPQQQVSDEGLVVANVLLRPALDVLVLRHDCTSFPCVCG